MHLIPLKFDREISVGTVAITGGVCGCGSFLALCPVLFPKFIPKFYYAKRRFPIISKYRHIYGVLNVDEIKN
jgi:hypothetical protein